MPVTAEGIETKAILERLMQYGDIKGQGFLYGHPQPASVTLELLAALDLLREKMAGADDSAGGTASEGRAAGNR